MTDETPDVRLNLIAKEAGTVSFGVALGLKPYLLIEVDEADDGAFVFDIEVGGGVARLDESEIPGQIAEMLDFVVQVLRDGTITATSAGAVVDDGEAGS